MKITKWGKSEIVIKHFMEGSQIEIGKQEGFENDK